MRIGPGQAIQVSAQNIRRERTGLHADVALFLFEDPPRLLGRDVFNIGRHEDMIRLCRACHRRLPKLAQESYPLESLENDVLYFLLWISREWESQQFQIDTYQHEIVPPMPEFLINPYILDGGGSILFGPRESAKSYICILFAASIASGGEHPWQAPQRPVLYVNLERDPVSMRRRDWGVARTLGIKETHIRWLHARGYTMESVARQVRSIATPETLVIYDSISRMGMGGLNDDQTANKSADLANGASRTWLAIGHTPRHDTKQLTGSMHFENAADILIRLTKDEHAGRLGIGLKVTKANDFKKPPMEITALTFDEQGLVRCEQSSSKEFPGLLDGYANTSDGHLQQLVEHMVAHGATTATQAAKALQLDRTTISNLFNQNETFVKLHRDNTGQYFGVRQE